MSRSFFVAGGTLDAAAPSYVVRAADEELCRALREGEYCYVLTPRQTGKSSMMVRTVMRLRDEGLTAAALDLTASGQNLTPEQWYTGLLDSLARQCGRTDELEDYWEAHRSLGPAQRWINAIVDILLPLCQGGLVLFIDEIDFVRSLPFPTDEFFAAIRECHNRRATDPRLHKLTFCLLGVATPADLIRDPRATPFNVGRRVDLADFTDAEALSLAGGLEHALEAAGGSPALRCPALQLLRRILRWTHGHPYLTQRLCYELVNEEHRVGSKTLTPRAVDRLCRTLFFSPAAQRQDINTLSVRDRLLLEEFAGDRAALLDLYGRVLSGARVADDETNRLVGLLRLSGAVVSIDHRLHVRNRIYARLFDRDWVRRHMPDAELQRQRRAVRLALFRATAVASIVVAALGGLSAIALANEAKARRKEAEASGLARSRGILIQERDQALKRLESALAKAQLEGERANRETLTAERERERATRAAAAKETQRQVAERRTVEAVGARTEAVHQGRLSRLRLARLHIADGWRLVGQGDSFGSLLHFGEGLRLEAANPRRERLHRLRLGSILAVSPRVRQVWRHSSGLTFADYSPDGKWVVVLGDDQVARVGAADGSWLSPSLRNSEQRERSLGWAAFSEDGEAVRYTFGGVEQFWSSRNPKNSSQIQGGEGKVAFSPNRKYQLRIADSTLQLAGTSGEAEAVSASFPAPVQRRPEFSLDGSRVATIHGDGTVRVWRVPDLTPVTGPLRHSGTILCAAFSRSGDLLVSGSEDRSARVWDLRTGRPSAPALPHGASVTDVTFSPDGSRVATAAVDGATRVWETKTGRAITPPLMHSLTVNAVRFSPDGTRIVTASADGTSRVWDAVTGRPASPILTHPSVVWTARFHPNGSRVLTACADGLAREWDLVTVDPVRPIETEPPADLPKGPLLLGSAAPVPRPLESPIARPALVIELPKSSCFVRLPDGRQGPFLPLRRVISGDLSAHGRRVVTADADGSARLWDSLSGKPLSPPMRHGLAVHLARFSPDERWIVTSSLDGTTRIWNAATGHPRTPMLFQSETVRHAALNADGTLLATATDTTLRLWDATTGEALSPALRRRVGPASLAFLGDTVWLKGNDGVWNRWDLTPLDWPLSRLRRLIAFLTGRALDDVGGAAPYPSRELLQAWQQLRADYSRTWRVSDAEQLRWHESEALEREMGRHWSAAAFHLGMVLADRPKSWELRQRRGRALAESGAWAEAAAEFAAADPGAPKDTLSDQHLLYYQRALCELAAGDLSGYRETCARLLQRYRNGSSDRPLDIAAWTCSLSPACAPASAEEALALSHSLVRRNPSNLGMAQTLGALQFRVGRFAEARGTLLDVIRRRGDGGEALDHLFLALSCRQLIRLGEARNHLDLARRELDKAASNDAGEERESWTIRLQLRLLRAEAERSIGSAPGL